MVFQNKFLNGHNGVKNQHSHQDWFVMDNMHNCHTRDKLKTFG